MKVIRRHQHLSGEQYEAAYAEEKNVFVEAIPGSGKTRVSAERFGVGRYSPNGRLSGKSCAGVSFTRSASNEMKERIFKRWGSSSLAWPHKVGTIDFLFRTIISQLIRKGVLVWPGGGVPELQVLDHWRGQLGARSGYRGTRRLHLTVQAGGRIVTTSVMSNSFGFGAQSALMTHVENGICTHADIRGIAQGCMDHPSLRGMLGHELRSLFAYLIVDEVFDANELDSRLLQVFVEDAGVPVTLVGDPWQALYGFRGAKPELVHSLLKQYSFTNKAIHKSYRFMTDDLVKLTQRMRQGLSCKLTKDRSSKQGDVILGEKWQSLWSLGRKDVLPLSFGQISNAADAVETLLLSRLTERHLGVRAYGYKEAVFVLGLHESEKANIDQAADSALAPGSDPDRVLSTFRKSLKKLGARTFRISRPKAPKIKERILELLDRRGLRGPFTPGMTFHQAKGREWDVVGVVLQPKQMKALREGLRRDQEDHRKVYVGLTRARREVFVC